MAPLIDALVSAQAVIHEKARLIFFYYCRIVNLLLCSVWRRDHEHDQLYRQSREEA